MVVGPYRFFFFSNEGNEPPHVHVQREKSLAKFWLLPVEIAASNRFSARELNQIRRIVLDNHERLEEAWNDYFR